MARLAPRVPEITDVLCEACGYVLNGLPPDGRCPECGKLISESVGDNRTAPQWETSNAKADGFFQTSLRLILHPTQFFRTFTVRGPITSARRFARLHWWLAGGLFSLAFTTHAFWYYFLLRMSPRPWFEEPVAAGAFIVIVAVMTIGAYLALDGITRLAARLTNWEATYRGIRLPYDVVLRGMYYHAAHYFPVGLAAAIVVVGHQILLFLQLISPSVSDRYLYLLSGQVILSALYLFQTYWIGMRNMMYANR